MSGLSRLSRDQSVLRFVPRLTTKRLSLFLGYVSRDACSGTGLPPRESNGGGLRGWRVPLGDRLDTKYSQIALDGRR